MNLLKLKNEMNVNIIKVWLIVFGMTILICSCGTDDPEAFKEVRVITAEKVYNLLGGSESTKIIDIRDVDSYRSGHLLNALNIVYSGSSDDSSFESILIEKVVDKSVQLIVYGSGANENSFKFADAALKYGYKFVYYYKEGVEDWKSNGYYFVIEFEGLIADFYPPEEDEYIIDVLSEGSYNAAHIPGAINIPHNTINDSNGNIVDNGVAVTSLIASKNANIVAYCRNPECPLGLKAVMGLMKLGYKNLYYYKEGLKAWNERGQPSEGVEED